MFVLGWILLGFGVLLLFLNNAGRKWDSREAQDTTIYISLLVIVIGLVILFLTGFK